MKTILFILAVCLIAITLMKYTFAEVTICPNGSYPIDMGEIICKVEPTGCPYGDSIPLDSTKCVAPEPVKEAIVTHFVPIADNTKIVGKNY